MMQTKEGLEHQNALLRKMLELEHERLKSERDRANELQTQTIELVKLLHEKTQRANADWHIIIKHFNELLEDEDIPNKHVKHGGKKRIRREANDRATLENKNIKKYSDDKLGRELKFPQKSISRSFARQPTRQR